MHELLRKLNSDLFGIFVMNLTLAIVLGLGALALVGVRSICARQAQGPAWQVMRGCRGSSSARGWSC